MPGTLAVGVVCVGGGVAVVGEQFLAGADRRVEVGGAGPDPGFERDALNDDGERFGAAVGGGEGGAAQAYDYAGAALGRKPNFDGSRERKSENYCYLIKCFS